MAKLEEMTVEELEETLGYWESTSPTDEGWAATVKARINEIKQELARRQKMYVVCRQCGESFDDLGIAYGHAGTCGSDQGFDVATESEAF